MTGFHRNRLTVAFSLSSLVALTTGFMFFASDDGNAQPSPTGRSVKTVRVVGTVAHQIKGNSATNSPLIEVPDAQVELRVASTGTVVVKAESGLDGRFSLRTNKPGTYQVCAAVDGAQGCGPRIVVKNTDVSTKTILLKTERVALHGQVLTGDNRACWAQDTYFGLDFSTKVSAAGNSGTAGPVRANVEGEYLLFPKQAGRYTIVADCEKSSAKGLASLGATTVRRDLNFANRAPKIRSMQALSSAGKSVMMANAGSTIEMSTQTRDPDGDKVEYLWRSGASATVPTGTPDAKMNWTLPAAGGTNSMYLIARDGKGGYDYQRFAMQNASERVAFSGTIIDEVTRQPVANASVSVGGVEVRSDARGWFRLEAKASADNDYVLNIRHRRYALMSRIYEQGQNSATYDLIRAEVSRVPAGSPLRFSDSGSSGPCGTVKGERAVPVNKLAPTRFLGVDNLSGDPREASAMKARLIGQMREKMNAQPRPCRARGVEIRMPDGALVDANGRRANGEITSSIATLDPTRRALPGNYRATTASGEPTELLSFGAVSAEFRDAAGNLLNLAPGMEADLIIPVPENQLAAAKPTIRLWSYNEEKGVWVEEGTADLIDTPDGKAYKGKTKHFSTINMDIALSGGTCTRLHVPPGTFTGWSNLLLRAYVSFGTSSQVKEVAINAADEYHALFRLPQGAATAPNTLRMEVTGTNGGLPQVLLNDVANIDGLVADFPASATSGNISYPPQYIECSTVEVAPAATVMPDYGVSDATGRPFFLTGPYGDFNPAGFDPTVYYTAIDPGNTRTTLGAWWAANGFGTDGLTPANASYTRASYLNHNDLGFGRDMHCIETDNPASTLDNLACYVSNYGGPDQLPSNADDAEAADRTKALATVTMEFDPTATVGQQVQFFAYAGGQAGGTRIGFADLDGFGPKPIPQLCTVCHGGTYDGTAGRAVGSKFREFDLPSFRYSSSRSYDYAPNTPAVSLSGTELGNFSRLNQMVLNSEPTSAGLPTDPLGKLIASWYPSGFAGGPAPVRPVVSSTDWPNDSSDMTAGATSTWQDVYHGPYAKACRTCHVARTGFYSFSNKSDYRAFSSGAVCSSPRVMPNAVITFKNFWATRNNPAISDNLVRQYEHAMGRASNTCQN